MKVVVLHNHYQLPGGEDEVFRAEADLLTEQGHAVVRFTVNNDSIAQMSKPALAAAAVWNQTTYRQLCELFRRERPDIAHFHNTHPLLSPAGYYAARAAGAGVVQSLHNFRLVCPNGLLFRDGHACEECLGRFVHWPGVQHACYRESRQATAVTAAMVSLHRVAGTWSGKVDVYIALSEFSRRKFVAGGLPENKVVVKPNFLVRDPGAATGPRQGYGLFVGRVSPEKGLSVLQRAWSALPEGARLRIVGGPVPTDLVPASNVEWLGFQPKERVYGEMRHAGFLVMPSPCYENCPMTIIEAFASGLPVVASDAGSAVEMVADRQTGLHFRSGDAEDLAQKLAWALAHPTEMAAMGRRARLRYEEAYTPAGNYTRLMEIYRRAKAA
jgi:glycosyltransferase involved in cell wall biosynthesis